MAGKLSLEDIRAKIVEVVEDALSAEVTDKALEQLYDSAEEVVYGAYEPKIYHRRKSFTKEEGYDFASDGEMRVRISANAPFNDWHNIEGNSGNEADLIFYGQDGRYGWTPPNDRFPTYMLSRPWIDDAYDKLSSGDALKNTMASALKARGLRVK